MHHHIQLLRSLLWADIMLHFVNAKSVYVNCSSIKDEDEEERGRRREEREGKENGGGRGIGDSSGLRWQIASLFHGTS
jgi:hypothetical protein